MSILSPQVVIEHGWVTGLSQYYEPEGAGIDLRLGKISTISQNSRGFLGRVERATPQSKVIHESTNYLEDFSFAFPPLISISQETNEIMMGKYCLFTTLEEVHLPDNITALITPRSTLYRSGIILETGNVAPGYSGTLTFGAMNLGMWTFEILSRARFAHIQFYEVDGDVNKYRGQWQHGRISQPDLEVQV